MRLEPLEYIVNKHMGEETITITKKALEKWKKNNIKLAKTYEALNDAFGAWICIGRADVLTDLLKHFEEE